MPYRELVTRFLKDRTRILVTHNMSLAVSSADLIICIDSNNNTSNNKHENPSDHNSSSSINSTNCVHDSRRGSEGGAANHSKPAKHRDSNNNISEQRNRTGSALSQIVSCCPPTELSAVIQKLKARNTDIGSAELSVFLEGLIAAAGLGVKDFNMPDSVNTSIGATSAAAAPLRCGTGACVITSADTAANVSQKWTSSKCAVPLSHAHENTLKGI